jgi:hypothetical protein
MVAASVFTCHTRMNIAWLIRPQAHTHTPKPTLANRCHTFSRRTYLVPLPGLRRATGDGSFFLLGEKKLRKLMADPTQCALSLVNLLSCGNKELSKREVSAFLIGFRTDIVLQLGLWPGLVFVPLESLSTGKHILSQNTQSS